ncbi:MAG: hypothetical protein ACM35H_13900 [Bacteroidota bacterium]|nr:hypothetical protein [Kiloniellaceae bacterium]
MMNTSYSRGAGRRLPAAAALLASLAAATPALADDGDADITWLNTPVIVVEGNGTVYNKVVQPGQNLTGKIRVQLDAGVSGRVRSWEAWPTLRAGGGAWKAMKGTGMSHSESYDSPRPKTVDEEFDFSIPMAYYAETAIAACNDEAANLRAQGLNNAAIFGQHRAALFVVDVGLTYDMSGVAGSESPQEVGASVERTVTCRGNPPAQTPVANDPQRTKPEVEQAVLLIHGKGSLHGVGCSVNLSGVIETNLPNTQVKFRYHSDDGRKSELKTVQTDLSGTVMFNHEYPLSSGGTTSGKIRMVGQHPDFTSAWNSYSVICGSPQGEASNDPTPPALKLDVSATKVEKMYKGFVCPAKVYAVGDIVSNDAMEGRAIHVVAQQGVFEPQQQVDESKISLANGHHLVIGYEPELRWSNVKVVGGALKQTLKFTFMVSRHNKAVATVHKMLVVSCRKPQPSGAGQGAPGGKSTGKPEPTHSQQQSTPLFIAPVKVK